MTAWHDLGFVGRRDMECEGSMMPGADVRVEPGARDWVRRVFEDVCGPSLRNEATSLVDGERQAAYGPPVDHWERVAQCWSAILGTEVTAHRAALCMAAMKLVRESYRADSENRLDAHGYLDIAGRCAGD